MEEREIAINIHKLNKSLQHMLVNICVNICMQNKIKLKHDKLE